jgi:hypothetical protein
MSEGVIWDSYGRAWTAERFAASDAAKMISLDLFVQVLREKYGIEDPDRLLHLMAVRSDPPPISTQGGGVDV